MKEVFNIYLISKGDYVLVEPLLIRIYKEYDKALNDLSLYNNRKKHKDDVNHIAHWSPKNPDPHFTSSKDFEKLIEDKKWKHYDLDYEFIVKEENMNIEFIESNHILGNKKYWTYYNSVCEEGIFNDKFELIEGKTFYRIGTVYKSGIFNNGKLICK